ncbi:MAG: hypothetical protein J6K50_02685 [Clostridia bacterium]|nr:hypothetical protein [Clostridia bacterium]
MKKNYMNPELDIFKFTDDTDIVTASVFSGTVDSDDDASNQDATWIW